jgi:neurofibromin 1
LNYKYIFAGSIVAKPYKRDKFEVTPQNVAYLSALVSVSEEVSLNHFYEPVNKTNKCTGRALLGFPIPKV